MILYAVAVSRGKRAPPNRRFCPHLPPPSEEKHGQNQPLLANFWTPGNAFCPLDAPCFAFRVLYDDQLCLFPQVFVNDDHFNLCNLSSNLNRLMIRKHSISCRNGFISPGLNRPLKLFIFMHKLDLFKSLVFL